MEAYSCESKNCYVSIVVSVALILLVLANSSLFAAKRESSNALRRFEEVNKNLNFRSSNTSICAEFWPSITLFLPLNLARSESRANEWENIFLRSYLFFWPLDRSNTTLLIVVDNELRNSPAYHNVVDRLTWYSKKYPHFKYDVRSNDFPAHLWRNDGHVRQQLLMFYADNFTDSKYVGFVDTDCEFISYVDVGALFHGKKPIIYGKIGIPDNGFWQDVPPSTQFLMKGLPEPMRCMSYFPVVLQTDDLKNLRSYIAKLHGKSFELVFMEYSAGAFSQFNGMCAYLWYQHQDAYYWNTRETHDNWDYKTGAAKGQNTNKSIYTPEMLRPLPRIAIHTRYHNYLRPNEKVLTEGYCRSPPFPKEIESHENFCKRYSHYNINEDMHYFESTTFFNVGNRTEILLEQYLRYERIKNCSHHWDFSLVELEFS